MKKNDGGFVSNPTLCFISPSILRAWFLIFIGCGVLTGCVVGPDFKRPDPPAASSYTKSDEEVFSGNQKFERDMSFSKKWWESLGSPKLNALIDLAYKNSPTLSSSRAKLRQAEELYSAQAGSNIYPKASLDMGAKRQKINPQAIGQTGSAKTFTTYDVSVGARYMVDLAGKERRELEALASQVDYQSFELDGARLSLASSIATTAISRAKFASQISAMRSILASKNEQLIVTKEQARLGLTSVSELYELHAQLDKKRAELTLLLNQLDRSEHLLATLSGQVLSERKCIDFELSEFTIPESAPLIVPAQLVRRRPDILAAEALLHAANADYGVAVARLYPQINLSANLGSQAISSSTLFGGSTSVWSLVGQLTQPLFDTSLPARKRASLAAFDAAASNYKTVVLSALQNVADTMQSLKHDAQSLTLLSSADAATQSSLEAVTVRYELGVVSYAQLLEMKQQAQQSQIDLFAALALRLTDSIELFSAFGGGYEYSSEPVAQL